MAGDQIDRILDHFPLFDGSGRRRFIAGAIVVIGGSLLNARLIEEALQDLKMEVLLASPLIVAGLALIIYTAGSILELFSDLFLIRMASGVFHAHQRPTKFLGENPSRLRRVVGWLIAVALMVPRAIRNLAFGMLGKTQYSISIERFMSDNAREYFGKLPQEVVSGIRQPVGDNAEFSFKYLVDRFDSETDKKWARRLIGRAKEVSTTTTALLAVSFISFMSGAVPSLVPDESRTLKELRDLNKQIPFLELGVHPDRDVEYIADHILNIRRRIPDLSVRKDYWQDVQLIIHNIQSDMRAIDDEAARTWFFNDIKESELAELAAIEREFRIMMDRMKRLSNQNGEGLKIENLDPIIKLISDLSKNSPRFYDSISGWNLQDLPLKIEEWDKFGLSVRHELKAARTVASIPLMKTIDSKLRQFDHELATRPLREILDEMVMPVLTISFLYLYLGFFVTIRNAAVAMIEDLAHQPQP